VAGISQDFRVLTPRRPSIAPLVKRKKPRTRLAILLGTLGQISLASREAEPILASVANNTSANISSSSAAASFDALEDYLARKLDQRTRRVSLAPWLYHLGLVEFSRYAHKSKGPEAIRVFNLMRARDLALVVAAYMLVPSELLGTIGLITDTMALQRLARIIPAEDIARSEPFQ
jgi:hypothetical protein